MADKYPLVLDGTSIEELQSGDSLIGIDLVADTTPQLGGNLDLNSSNITGTGDIDITGTVTADGLVVDGGITEKQVTKSASFTPSFTEGTIYSCSGSITITMPTATAGKSFTIIASTPPSWSGTIKWSGGSAPSGTGIVIYTFISDGSNWYGMEAGNGFA